MTPKALKPGLVLEFYDMAGLEWRGDGDFRQAAGLKPAISKAF